MPETTLVCLYVRKGTNMEHTGFGLNKEICECSAVSGTSLPEPPKDPLGDPRALNKKMRQKNRPSVSGSVRYRMLCC